jgi:AAA+ superfamily predicted ATPase
MFTQINSPCIVLLEDFDNYFDGRKCIIGGSISGTNNTNIKFTFDVILNCLDGVYNTYEGVTFIMTANDIDKIDTALKNRPSRFKYVRKFDNPDDQTRTKLIGDWSGKTNGLNIDQIMRLKECQENGLDLETSILKLELEKKIPTKATEWLICSPLVLQSD